MSVSLYGGDITLTVEAGFSAATGTYGAWDVAVFDTDTWGPDVVWTDITGYVRQFSTVLGRNREYDHYQAATAEVTLDNRDGRFSPENMAGPYVTGGVTGVRPLRPLRIRAVYAGITYPIFYGAVEAYQEQFPGNRDALVVLPCVDGIAKLAAFDGLEQTPVGGGETAGARIHRVLDSAAWDQERDIDDSGTLVQATTLAQNAWGEVLLTADSDGGEVWQEPDGTLKFEFFGAPFQNTRSNTIQATYSDTGTIRYQAPEFKYDGDLVVNVAALARAGGTQQTVTDMTSTALYGPRRFSRSDLICTTDTQVLSLATFMISIRSQPEKRVSAITSQPRRAPSVMWPEVLGRGIRDRVAVTAHNPQSGTTLTRECFIDGIEHAANADNWTTRFRLSQAFIGAASFGRWDSSLWDMQQWGF